MIRAYVHDGYPSSPTSVSVSVVLHPPEGSMDVRPRILHLGTGPGGGFNSWDEVPADGEITGPTMNLENDTARALLDALTRHYQGAEDSRALRRDYDGERKRVDLLIGHLAETTRALAGKPS